MRITILLTVLTLFNLQANTYSQNEKISLDMEEVSVLEVLKQIESTTKFKFLFNRNHIDVNRKVTVKAEKKAIKAILEELFKNTPVKFEVYEEQIILGKSTTSASLKNRGSKANRPPLQMVVKGTVTDVDNAPLPGVNVIEEGTSNGVVTDFDGNFELQLIDNSHRISFSYIGYQTVVLEAAGGEMNVQLKEDVTQLEGVTVSGYGIRRRTETTGSVSAITAEALENRSIQTPDQALQGRATGVRLINTSGAPGANARVRIRGIGSINAGSTPLWVVDGIRIETSNRGTQASTNIMSSLNPEDIESMEVLKDASATAIYGADGANGVVLITTKRGREGKTRFKFSSQFGISKSPPLYHVMDGPEFVTAMQEAYANRYEDLGTTAFGGIEYGDPREAGRQAAIASFGHPDEVGTYNWGEAVLQTGIQRRTSLSATGGNEKTTFYVSAGYNNQEGTVKSVEFERITLNTNIHHQATDRLSFDLKTNLAYSRATGLSDSDGSTSGANNTNSPFHGAVTTPVTIPIYNEDGSYQTDNIPGVNYNMVQVLDLEKRETRNSELLASFAATYKITDDLSFRSRWNIDHRFTRGHRFFDPRIPRYGNYGGGVWERTRMVTSWNADQVFDYARTFGEDHNLSAIVGFEYQSMHSEGQIAHGRELPSYLFRTLNATAVNYATSGTYNDYKKAGFFSRVTYDYKGKYFANASLRYDGHSRFGADRRWGTFYSLGFAWDAAREPFMENSTVFTKLKPRISYGTTGNSSLNNYASMALYGVGGSYDGNKGLRPIQLGNASLTWEVARTLDIAVDWALFGGRVYGVFDFFRKNNESLLLERNLPTNSGYSSIWDNVGVVRNQGFEGELGVRLLDVGKFKWTSEFNITVLESEIIDLGGQQNIGNTVRLGEPINLRWGYFTAGVNPADGRPMWYDKDGNITYTPSSTEDRGIIGSQLPDFYGGFFNRFSYGPLSLEVLFHYEYGRDIRNVQGDQFYDRPDKGRTLGTHMWDRWQQPGDITHIPRFYSTASFPGSGNVFPFSTRSMQDGSFIRLKNIRLNYEVPSEWLEKAGISNLSVFVQGENLLTWTEFDGPDPELISQAQNFYPQPRVFLAGLTMGF
ncbi:TonB-dependent receptor [Sinomicrobium sp.]